MSLRPDTPGQYGFAVEKDFPARRRKKPHSHARQCRLAAPGLAHQAERLAATYGKRYAIHCANFAPHSPEHTLPHRKRTAHITKIKKRRRGGRHAYPRLKRETEKRQTRKSASILVPFLVKKLVFTIKNEKHRQPPTLFAFCYGSFTSTSNKARKTMKRIASCCLPPACWRLPSLLEKPKRKDLPCPTSAPEARLSPAAWLPARTILPPWLGTPLGSLSSPVPK